MNLSPWQHVLVIALFVVALVVLAVDKVFTGTQCFDAFLGLAAGSGVYVIGSAVASGSASAAAQGAKGAIESLGKVVRPQ